MGETGKRLHLVLGWNGPGHDAILDALQAGRVATGQGDRVLNGSMTAMAGGKG